MPAYTPEEYLEMVLLYGQFHYNANTAATEFRRRHPGRRPNHNTILRAVQRGRENGDVVRNGRNTPGADRRARNVQNEERIINYIREHPRHSIRDMVRVLRLSYWTNQQILRDEG